MPHLMLDLMWSRHNTVRGVGFTGLACKLSPASLSLCEPMPVRICQSSELGGDQDKEAHLTGSPQEPATHSATGLLALSSISGTISLLISCPDGLHLHP